MRIKLDESLSRHLRTSLLEAGHDATTAIEQGLGGKSDTELAVVAREEGRMVFTLDSGFADLRRYPPGSHPGVVVFRPRSMGPAAVNRFIFEFVGQSDLKELAGCIVVVQPHRVRVRRPPGQAV